jgi:hypothetical protein
MQLFDTISLGDARVTRDGYLVADAKIARTGIQIYAGREVGKPEMATVRVYRPEGEVFGDEAMASFAHRPVTIDHPSEAVSAKNWKQHSVGMTGGDIRQDGKFIRVPMTLMDGAAIDTVKSGKRELSCGYMCDLKWEAGQTPEGEAYDAVQTNIRGNHLAIVSAGRAGSDCRIGDGTADDPRKKDRSMTDANRTSLVVDGLTVSLETRDAEIVRRHVEKLSTDLAGALQRVSDADKRAKDAEDKSQAEIAKRDAQIDDLKAKVLSDADLDARVQARADLIATAKAIVGDVDFRGKPDAEVRKAVVVSKLGDKAVEGKTQAYLDARFDILAEDARATGTRDPIRDAIRTPANDGKPTQLGDSSAEYARMLERDATAWKKEA